MSCIFPESSNFFFHIEVRIHWNGRLSYWDYKWRHDEEDLVLNQRWPRARMHAPLILLCIIYINIFFSTENYLHGGLHIVHGLFWGWLWYAWDEWSPNPECRASFFFLGGDLYSMIVFCFLLLLSHPVFFYIYNFKVDVNWDWVMVYWCTSFFAYTPVWH